MTWEQWIIKRLTGNGLFDTDAQAVMNLVKSDDVTKSMTGRWNDSIEGYPQQLQAAIWLSVKRITIEWIDANKPNAWYRPMFL